MRQAARIQIGINEAFAEVNSEALLTALVVNPLEAMFLHERQKADAELNARRKENQGEGD